MAEINERLRSVRKELKISQKDFSATLGLKQSYYSDVENGKKNVTSRIVLEAREKYNISSEWLYTGKGSQILSNGDILNTPKNVHPLYTNDENEAKPSESDGNRQSNDEIERIGKARNRTDDEQRTWEKEIDRRYEKMRKYNELITSDLIQENSELATLLQSLKTLSTLDDIASGIRYSHAGDVVRELPNIYKNNYIDNHGHKGKVEYALYSEYKSRIIEVLQKIEPYKLIFNEFAQAVEKFTDKVRSLSKELHYEDDYTEPIDNSDVLDLSNE